MCTVYRSVLVLAALGGAPGGAAAHALLERAEPAVGAAVGVAPAELRLHFSEPLEPAFSRAEVADTEGRRADLGKPRVDAADPSLLRVPLPAGLRPGTYRVTWRAVSVDTHVTQGSYSFRVAP